MKFVLVKGIDPRDEILIDWDRVTCKMECNGDFK